MNDSVMEELLSAYLDGELNAEEEARLERALAESERWRQLHEEFLALRTTLQALPRQTLDEGFSRRVVERIRSLDGQERPRSAASKDGAATSSDPVVKVVASEEGVHRNQARVWLTRHRRSVAWAAAAAALVAFALLVSPSGDRPPELVQDVTDGNGVNSPSDDDGETIPAPLEPAPAEANGDAERERRPSARVMADDEPESQTPPEEAVAPNAIAQAPETPAEKTSTDPRSKEEDQPQETRIAPDTAIARAEGEPPKEPSQPREARDGPVELAIDYDNRRLHIVRLAVSPVAARTGVFDDILETEGLSFQAAGTQARADAANPPPMPPVEAVLVRAVPAQIDGAFRACNKRREDFRPLAVYTSTFVYDWVLPVTESLPAQGENAGDEAFRDFVSMLMTEPNKTFAWRAPATSHSVLDAFFPIPENHLQQAAAAKTVRAADVDPNTKVLVMFFLHYEHRGNERK